MEYCFRLVNIKNSNFEDIVSTYFLAFGLTTEGYSVSLYIQSKCGKMRTRITPNMDTFDVLKKFCVKLKTDTCIQTRRILQNKIPGSAPLNTFTFFEM